jgi:hypothetical protein
MWSQLLSASKKKILMTEVLTKNAAKAEKSNGNHKLDELQSHKNFLAAVTTDNQKTNSNDPSCMHDTHDNGKQENMELMQ